MILFTKGLIFGSDAMLIGYALRWVCSILFTRFPFTELVIHSVSTLSLLVGYNFLIASYLIKKFTNEHPGTFLTLLSLSFSGTGAVKPVT